MSVQEGWTDFGGLVRKHFFPADDDTALCGKWTLSPFVRDSREAANLQADTGEATSDDCEACRRKLDRRKS